MTDFKPYEGRKRKSDTGCVSEINDHLFEGRYSPKWPGGKKHARNIYAHTREECEEKLKVTIKEMKAELPEIKNKRRSPKPHLGHWNEGIANKKDVSKENPRHGYRLLGSCVGDITKCDYIMMNFQIARFLGE